MSAIVPQPGAPAVIFMPMKNVGVAAALAFLFGPIGLLYATLSGGLIMMAVSLVVGVLTLGLGLLLTWPASIVWAIMAAKKHNEQLTTGAYSS